MCHALADAYATGAKGAGREVRRIEIAKLDLALVRSAEEWKSEAPAPAQAAQQDILWADHVVLFYPLWIGTIPAVVKGFLEQVFREGFAFGTGSRNPFAKPLRGRSARIVVTMGMPAFLYRWYFGAHSLKSLERNLLRFVGFAPVHHTILGLVEVGSIRRSRWLAKMEALGRHGR
ncbi:MAG: NAD(P)H-dependent oxidoreductase [Myxococcales bacterium]